MRNSARVDNHANQLATTTSPSNETKAGGGLEREREREREMRERTSVYPLGALCGPNSAFGFEFLLQMDEAPA
ncbi:hypothetical protein N7445_004854 [Penicillium cf. griseofulvum]|nr:hypothetical protein N7445_004854 [Penicillium cf. griseofulvum]